MHNVVGRKHSKSVATAAAALLCIVLLSACGVPPSHPAAAPPTHPVRLQAMTVSWGTHLQFEHDFFQSFATRHQIAAHLLPNARLQVYRQLLKARSSQPDLLEIDVVWPGILADDLLDLKPYLPPDNAFVPQLLDSYSVRGRLVALPAYVDLGVLYYRPDLLAKYGFTHPPATWEELAAMASRIQQGERRGGNKDFWGYVWQGSASEGGTCNAVEWQASSGGGTFIEPSGFVHVASPLFVSALHRAANWIGDISPPAQYAYREDDAMNLWNAGQTAFMRNWSSGYGMVAAQPGKDRQHFKVAPLPAGLGGPKGTLGGLGIGVSKYAANRALAIQAVLELTSAATESQRLSKTGGLSTHLSGTQSNRQDTDPSVVTFSPQLIGTLVARPSSQTGTTYESASIEYARAVNSVLRRKSTPEAAMANLERTLVKLTGLPALHN